MVLLIGYDLRGTERPSSWDDVRSVIEKKAIDSARPLYSQWFVETNSTAHQWYQFLEGVIDSNDRLFISEITRNHFGWLPNEFWEWLRERGIYPP